MFINLNRNLKIFLVSDSLYYGVQRAYGTLLPLLITLKITNNDLKIVGYIISYYMVVHAIVEMMLSKQVAKTNEHQKIGIVSMSLSLLGLCLAVLGFSTRIWHVLLIQTIIAILDSVYTPLKWNMFSNLIGKKNGEYEWGLEDVLSTITVAVMTAITGIIVSSGGYKIAFVFMGLVYAISGTIFYLIQTSSPAEPLANIGA